MRGGAKTLLPLVGAAILALCVPARAAGQPVPCEASPKVRKALRNLPQSTGDADADRTSRIGALKALLKRFPNDVFVHHRYQDIAMYPTAKERDAVIAEYRALADRHPNDKLYAYLAARSVIGSNTKQVIPELDKLAANLPPARLALVRIYQASGFKDNAKARAHLEAYIAACPAALAAFNYFRPLESSDFVTANTARLRKLLEGRTDVDSLSYYSTLWTLEFRVKPATEHEALRKQVADDLKRLRAVDPGKGDTLYYTLQEGYKLTNDTEGAKWTADQLRKSSTAGYSTARNEWLKEHPFPRAGDSAEKRKAFNEAYAEVTGDWVGHWPNEVGAWFDRVGALGSSDVVAAPSDVEAAGEGLLRAVAKNPRSLSFGSPIGGNSFALLVGHLYAQHNVRTDRLRDLVKQGLAEVDSPVELGGWESDLYLRPPGYGSSDFTKWYGRLTVADIWLKTKNADLARQALLDVQALADKSKPKPDPKDPQQTAKQRTYLTRQSEYWYRMGDLAQLEGHRTDAMTYYQNALLARANPPASGLKDDLAEKARALWTDIGGSNEGWQAWLTRKDLLGVAAPEASATTLTKTEKALPDFNLADLNGARWRLADLKGKATLVGIWATW